MIFSFLFLLFFHLKFGTCFIWFRKIGCFKNEIRPIFQGWHFEKEYHRKKTMHTCYLIVFLLVLWFQSICGNQNAVLDKKYSDRLTEPSNQQSSRQQNNKASNHATVSALATEPSPKSQTPHLTSNVNCPKRTFYFSFVLSFSSLLNSKRYFT